MIVTKSTGVINQRLQFFSQSEMTVTVSKHAQQQDPEDEAAKWNLGIIIFVIQTYAFPTQDPPCYRLTLVLLPVGSVHQELLFPALAGTL